jgi:hypothetical protein
MRAATNLTLQYPVRLLTRTAISDDNLPRLELRYLEVGKTVIPYAEVVSVRAVPGGRELDIATELRDFSAYMG